MTESNRFEGARLHGVSLSPFVRKVRAILAIKGIDYELVNVMPGAAPPEFQALSPMSKVPVWEETGFSVPDSSVIAAYLERCCPTPSIHPVDPKRLARELFWEEYADTRLVEAGGPVFFQRFVRARIFGEEPDEEIVRRNLEEILPPIYDQLETLFVPEMGSVTLTIGPLSVWAPIVNLEHVGAGVDATAWPGLAGFVRELGAQAPIAGILEEERALLGSA